MFSKMGLYNLAKAKRAYFLAHLKKGLFGFFPKKSLFWAYLKRAFWAFFSKDKMCISAWAKGLILGLFFSKRAYFGPISESKKSSDCGSL